MARVRRLALTLALVFLPLASARAQERPDPDALPGALRALAPWLRHEDWSVRSLAAFELSRRTEAGIVGLLAPQLRSEAHPYVAATLLGALGGRPRRELLLEGGLELPPILLRWAQHAHPTLRARALGVLATLAGHAFGDRPDLYEGWWQRARSALELELERLQAQASNAVPGTIPRPPVASSTSAPLDEPPERFYGDVERMRRHGLEVVLVLDHTGSMGPVIGAAKAQALALLRRLRGYVPGLRIGLVTYDDGPRVRLALTHDESAFVHALNKVAAGGGGDFEEGVDKALHVALRQEKVGWSQRALRVIILIGDAPPHEGDVPGLLRGLRAARQDELFESPVIVHAVAATSQGVEHFPQIALAAGGAYVTLERAAGLSEELVGLSLGSAGRERIRAWIAEIDALRAQDPEAPRQDGAGR